VRITMQSLEHGAFISLPLRQRPSFTPMDQDPRGPWTRCSTRPCLPLPICETVRQANGLRDVDWTFGKFILLAQTIENFQRKDPSHAHTPQPPTGYSPGRRYPPPAEIRRRIFLCPCLVP